MVEMEDFKYGGTNITAFRLVDPGSELVQQVSRKSSRGYYYPGSELVQQVSSKSSRGYFPGSEQVEQVSRKYSRWYLMKIDFVIELYFPKNDSVLFT